MILRNKSRIGQVGRDCFFSVMFLALMCLASINTSFAGKMYTPPQDGLRVCVDSFMTDSFPEVEVLVRLLAPEKLDYRYFNGNHFGLIEEEIVVRDLKAEPFAPPLSIAMVIDDSGSLEGGNRYLKTAMKHFVEEMAETDQASVTTFNRSVQVLQKMTYSKHELNKSIATIKSYGATALYDGMMAGLQQLSTASGKRVLLVVSDGCDQVYPGGIALSRFNVNNVIQTAQGAGVEVYSIAVGDVEHFNNLKTISDNTRGLFWCAPSSSYLKPLFDKVTTSLGAMVKVRYTSPNANFDRKDRTVVVDVRRGNYHGRGVGTYWLDYKTPSSSLNVQKKVEVDNKLSSLRLFTWGTGRLPLELEFYLYDNRGNLVRHGLTTKDGFGKLERSKAPQLSNIKSGTYRLILRKEGVEVDFDHSMVTIDPSSTLTMSLGFSKIVFRRDSREWYNMTHHLGNCAELIAVTIEDHGTGKVIYDGLLDDFSKNREVAFWLQEGAYKVSIKNKWPVVDNHERQNAVLKAEMSSEFRIKGGQQLFFNTVDTDFITPAYVLSREYQIANADESPYRAITPVSQKEVEMLAAQQARRYREGTFTRHKEHGRDSDSLYVHQGGKSLNNRITRLMEERIPDRTIDIRAQRASNARFSSPYHNSSLNESHKTINNGKKPQKMVPPSYEPTWEEMYGTSDSSVSSGQNRANGKVSDNGEELFDDGNFSGVDNLRYIAPSTPSKAEDLRLKARQIILEREESEQAQAAQALRKAAEFERLKDISIRNLLPVSEASLDGVAENSGNSVSVNGSGSDTLSKEELDDLTRVFGSNLD